MIRRPLITALFASAGLWLCATQTFAQQSQLAPTVETERPAPVGPEQLVLQQASNASRPPPLGSDMFRSAANATSSASTADSAIDPSHIMRPGDKLRVTLWGLVNEEQELVVDPQGNVVVPGVGPVRVAGVTAARAPAVIEAASRRVYSSGVQIYATATSAATSQILVTGPVIRPGAYQGASDEALIVFLQRAGGIDPDRGSYRRLRIVRNGQALANADLYEFLRAGALPDVSLHNGDAIVVEEQGSVIAVVGDVRSAYSFELLGQTGLGAEIMRYARPRPGASHVAIVGVRDGLAYSAYLTLAEFADFTLVDGDRVQFETDSRAPSVLVRLEGAHSGGSVFSVPRGTTVGSLLQQVAVDPDADMESLHLRRDSVRVIQKQLLNEGLDRLERTTLMAPARSSGEASARASQATFVSRYIESARQIEPLGILSLNGRDPGSVLLESGDVIVIPRHSQIVSISGEVLAPQSMIATENRRLSAYIDDAGGFSPRADRRRILVFRQDGQLRTGGMVAPGDRVLVPTKQESSLLPLIGDVAVIALAAARLSR
ncbi:polysaccharide biosynthesis/export family protein [Brevundimonas sp.]|uniref:polysaccharide biosynthesis/export family protein n=1 Tax=Brevundimonas sp. TaxID=1871086 RepID=UPI003BA97823